MAHDGQYDLMIETPVMKDILALTQQAVKPLETLNTKAINNLRELVTLDNKVSSSLIETPNRLLTELHGLPPTQNLSAKW